jgi:hypothetical protein
MLMFCNYNCHSSDILPFKKKASDFYSLNLALKTAAYCHILWLYERGKSGFFFITMQTPFAYARHFTGEFSIVDLEGGGARAPLIWKPWSCETWMMKSRKGESGLPCIMPRSWRTACVYYPIMFINISLPKKSWLMLETNRAWKPKCIIISHT